MRNQKYWWWSRRLKEVLRAYGADNYVSKGPHSLKGPFYTGMSRVMILPEFNIFLYSPTSTSVQFSVALNFCGDSGMILEFDNSKGAARYTPGFDCSWISRFREEDERYDGIEFSIFCWCY